MATTITITVDGDEHTISGDVVPSNETLSVLQELRSGNFTARAGGDGNINVAYGKIVNEIMVQHQQFAAEVTQITQELGTRGILGGQIELTGASGEWRNLVQHINTMSANLTTQLRSISMMLQAFENGDYSRKLTVDAAGETAEIRDALNRLAQRLASQSGSGERAFRRAASSPDEMPKLSGANEVETTIEVFDEIEPGND